MRIAILCGLIGALVSGQAQAQQRATKPAAPKVAAPKAAPAPAPALPVFSFLGDDTETPTSRTTLNAATCTAKGDEKGCDDFSNPKIAGTELKWLSMSFHKGLLYRVMGASWTNRYDILLDAFTAKYGQPQIEVKKWQAKSGATFDNSVATWKFKGGELELDSLGPDLNTLSFVFVSVPNSPPRDAPKVDF